MSQDFFKQLEDIGTLGLNMLDKYVPPEHKDQEFMDKCKDVVKITKEVCSIITDVFSLIG
jgi:hypothetical protein